MSVLQSTKDTNRRIFRSVVGAWLMNQIQYIRMVAAVYVAFSAMRMYVCFDAWRTAHARKHRSYCELVNSNSKRQRQTATAHSLWCDDFSFCMWFLCICVQHSTFNIRCVHVEYNRKHPTSIGTLYMNLKRNKAGLTLFNTTTITATMIFVRFSAVVTHAFIAFHVDLFPLAELCILTAVWLFAFSGHKLHTNQKRRETATITNTITCALLVCPLCMYVHAVQ